MRPVPVHAGLGDRLRGFDFRASDGQRIRPRSDVYRLELPRPTAGNSAGSEFSRRFDMCADCRCGPPQIQLSKRPAMTSIESSAAEGERRNLVERGKTPALSQSPGAALK